MATAIPLPAALRMTDDEFNARLDTIIQDDNDLPSIINATSRSNCVRQLCEVLRARSTKGSNKDILHAFNPSGNVWGELKRRWENRFWDYVVHLKQRYKQKQSTNDGDSEAGESVTKDSQEQVKARGSSRRAVEEPKRRTNYLNTNMDTRSSAFAQEHQPANSPADDTTRPTENMDATKETPQSYEPQADKPTRAAADHTTRKVVDGYPAAEDNGPDINGTKKAAAPGPFHKKSSDIGVPRDNIPAPMQRGLFQVATDPTAARTNNVNSMPSNESLMARLREMNPNVMLKDRAEGSEASPARKKTSQSKASTRGRSSTAKAMAPTQDKENSEMEPPKRARVSKRKLASDEVDELREPPKRPRTSRTASSTNTTTKKRGRATAASDESMEVSEPSRPETSQRRRKVTGRSTKAKDNGNVLTRLESPSPPPPPPPPPPSPPRKQRKSQTASTASNRSTQASRAAAAKPTKISERRRLPFGMKDPAEALKVQEEIDDQLSSYDPKAAMD